MKLFIKLFTKIPLSLGLALIFLIPSCDYLEQEEFNEYNDDALIWNYFENAPAVLNEVYDDLDEDWISVIGYRMEYHTDNAVNMNDVSRYAAGGWTVSSSPFNDWQLSYHNIRIINSYLENGLNTPFMPSQPVVDSIVRKRYYGEAFFLRAWNEAVLLREYGGPVNADGTEIMGFPIVTEVLPNEDYINLPRNTYEECVNQIIADCDTAIAYLPDQFLGDDQYLGKSQRGRACKLGAMALKVRVALYAASPLFNPENDIQKWQRAALFASELIQEDGGLQDLSAYGEYTNTDNPDDFWRTSFRSNNTIERENFPASIFGNGTVNPSQNLVDAFPMANGYPIDFLGSGYNPENPYAGRDARLKSFIFTNGDTDYQVGPDPVQTYEGGADASGGLKLIGTRTGYYMKKHLAKINLDPNASGATTSKNKFGVYLGRAELYLSFAEAVNEAYSPLTILGGITAKDALTKIRKRGNLPTPDFYLNAQASGGKETFRELVKNERRIELSFSWHRFFDLRRWKEDLNEPIYGVKLIKNGDGSVSYTYDQTVETRNYSSHMYYGPIPYDEVIKSNGVLKQNYGW